MLQPKNFKDIDKAVLLYLGGVSQKQISEKLKVTEKTVGVWLQPTKKRLLKCDNMISKLENRLDALISADSSTEDIKNIAYAIDVLEKRKLNKITI